MVYNYKTKLGQLVNAQEISNVEELLNSRWPLLQPKILQQIAGSSLTHKLVHVRRVQRTTHAGKVPRFSVMVVVGNKKNLFGLGISKNKEKFQAINKALRNALKNAFVINMDSLKQMSSSKVGSSIVSIIPRKKRIWNYCRSKN